MAKVQGSFNPLINAGLTVLGLILIALFQPNFPAPLQTLLIASYFVISLFALYSLLRVPRTKAFYTASAIVAIYVALATLLIGLFKYAVLDLSLFFVQLTGVYFYAAAVVALIALGAMFSHIRSPKTK